MIDNETGVGLSMTKNQIGSGQDSPPSVSLDNVNLVSLNNVSKIFWLQKIVSQKKLVKKQFVQKESFSRNFCQNMNC